MLLNSIAIILNSIAIIHSKLLCIIHSKLLCSFIVNYYGLWYQVMNDAAMAEEKIRALRALGFTKDSALIARSTLHPTP